MKTCARSSACTGCAIMARLLFRPTWRQGVYELKSLRLILAFVIVLGPAAAARAQTTMPASSQQPVVQPTPVPPLPSVEPDELAGLTEEQQPALSHQGVLVETPSG